MSRTLRGRIGIAAVGVAAAWIAVLTAAFNVLLGSQLRDEADSVLRTRATVIVATIDTDATGRVTVDEPADDHALDAGVWILQGADVIEKPPALGVLHDEALRLAGRDRVSVDAHGYRFYALTVPTRPGAADATVVAALSLDPYRETARFALVASACLAAAIVAAAYPVTRWAVGRALRPVAEMSALAAAWGDAGTADRFAGTARPAELAGLAANLDAVLDRLAGVLRHEQLRTGELSHELRTPLSRVIAEVDWLTARPRSAAEAGASHAAIAAAAERMRTICDTLLADARDQHRVDGRCRVHAVVGALDGPPVRLAGPDATAGVSAAVAARILGTLVDNARRYARSEVTVSCAADGPRLTVTVTDDGPGVPEHLTEAIFVPGVRADPGDGHDGAGLGLALARRLARAAGGDIAVVPSPRGAVFAVRLPSG